MLNVLIVWPIKLLLLPLTLVCKAIGSLVNLIFLGWLSRTSTRHGR